MLTPDDLVHVADLCQRRLLEHAADDWEARAANLDWTCRETLRHMCRVGYAMRLAGGASGPRPYAFTTREDASIDELIDTVHDDALVLAAVARAAAPVARAHHAAGMADPEGFVAMEIDEQLMHTSDIVTAFGARLDAPEDVVRRLLDRLFPWWPTEADPWQALLWANGRGALPGHPNQGDTWVWHCAPLEEWNGEVPRWDPVTDQPVT